MSGRNVCILLLVALLCLVLVGGVALAQTGRPGPGQAMRVQAGTSTGGGYHLTSRTWQVSGTVAGEHYVLNAPYLPELRGNGCCCTYLPCIMQNQ